MATDTVFFLRSLILSAIERCGIAYSIEQIALEHPALESHGDWSTNIALQAFAGVREQGRWNSPRALAEALVQEMQTQLPVEVERIAVAGPGFINFFLAVPVWSAAVHAILEAGERYGSSTEGQGKIWAIEHTSPNPNKAMHLGHLRNNVTGMAIANIWEFQGYRVIRDMVDNDRGIAIAKLMWGYLKFAHSRGEQHTDLTYWFEHQDEWSTPDEKSVRPDRFVEELYVKAHEDCKDPAVDAQVRQLVVDWEAGEPKNRALWARVLEYSHDGQNRTLARLGNIWHKRWREHEHYQAGKDLVEKGLSSGVFRKLENGAVLTNLESYGIPDTIVIKNDGTSLYITQDLALTRLKRETFHADRLFWVIGPEQSLALKQMFAVCEQLGIGKVADYTHIPFGYMSIKGQGKMSSRLGNVVYIDDLLDMAKAQVLEIMQEGPLSPAERDATAEAIAVGAVKYSILRVGRTTDTAFDFATSLSLDGDSGPYIQYAHARCCSVLERAGRQDETARWHDLEPAELALMKWLARFPEAVSHAGHEMAPNVIAGYLLELAQRWSAFYHECPILTAVGVGVSVRRLQLATATKHVLANGLSLLGIAAPERM